MNLSRPWILLALAGSLSLALNLGAFVLDLQQGLNGYTGAIDTQLRAAGVQSTTGTDDSVLDPLNADSSDGVPPGPVQALIRFDHFVGLGPGQIPPNTAVGYAQLILRSTANNAESPGPIRLYQMLQDWQPTCTWASCFQDNGNPGVQADDIEASSAEDGNFTAAFPNPGGDPLNTQQRVVDVTARVQSWVNGTTPNYGWVLLNDSLSNFRFDSSETGILTNRPRLRIVFGEDRPPTFAVQPAANTTLIQCRTLMLSAAVDGLLPFRLQWLKDGNVIDTNANPSAATATLTITNVALSDAGTYRLRAENNIAATHSSNALVTINEDLNGPTMLSAAVNPGRTAVTITYDEPLDPSEDSDRFKFSITDASSGSMDIHTAAPLQIQNGTNLVLTLTTDAWIEGVVYRVYDYGGGARDLCRGHSSDAASIAIAVPIKIIDTKLQSTDPDAPHDTENPLIIDGNPYTEQVLIQFPNLFGAAPGQIPPGASTICALLRLNQTDAGDPATVHRMLVQWNASASWNSLESGISNDGIEAAVAPESTITRAANGIRFFDVTATVRVWADNPGSNFGWVILPSGGDSVRFTSSEDPNVDLRPTLIAFFCDDYPFITNQPPGSLMTNEHATFSIKVGAAGARLQYQWQKAAHGSAIFADIIGATNDTLTIADAQLSDSGDYRVIVGNISGSQTSSTVTYVQIIPADATVQISRGLAGAVTVSWSPAIGALEESTNLVHWTPSAQQNGASFSPAPAPMFYRVRF